MTRIILALAMFTAACTSSAPDTTLTEQFAGTSVTSHDVGGRIETVVDANPRAAMSWDRATGAAELVIADTTIGVTLDIPFELVAANRAAVNLWESHQDRDLTLATDDSIAGVLGCECHWDSGACGGGGTVACCCWWSDICSEACY